MSFSKIMLFSTFCFCFANSNVFSSSVEQSFYSISTNCLSGNSDANTNVFQSLDSRTTTEQIANVNSECNCEIITDSNRPIANIPTKTRQIKKMRSQTITANIVNKNTLIQNIDEYNSNLFKSDAQICNIKIDPIELNLYSDSNSSLDNSIDSIHDNFKKIQNNGEVTSRKSTGISPSQTNNSLETQFIGNMNEISILPLMQKKNENKKNNTPVKKDLLTDKEKITMTYLKNNVLNNKSKTNKSLNLSNLKQSNIRINYIKVNNNKQNNAKFITNFIEDTEAMYGICDPVYYNTKFNILNKNIDNLQSDQKKKLQVLLKNLLQTEFNYNKNTAIQNYYDTCVFNKNANTDNNTKRIIDYFYNIRLSDNNTFIKGIQNYLKKVELLSYERSFHVINIIEIYKQWEDIYSKYNNLYNNLH